jgi:hypothetical protein
VNFEILKIMKNRHIKTMLLLSPVILARCGGEGTEVPDGSRPNILIAIADDISYPHMGAYGTAWIKTPGFDRVAGEGILFMNAYTPNAKSSPSRACLLTGRNSWQLDAAANHVPVFPPEFLSFVEVLGEKGYYTGYTAKGWAPGLAADSTGKPRQLTGRPFNSRKLDPPAGGISGNDYASNFEEFLDSRTKGQPFCFWYGATEPHRRYEYGSGVSKGGKKTADIDRVFSFWPDNEIVRNDLLDYAFEIEHFDKHLVRMLDILEKEGELDNTIIIVTADNGMPFPRAKGQAFEYSNHVPLAIMWGQGIRKRGRILYDYVSFIDIAPTVLEAAGIGESESGMKEISVKSLIGIFRSSKNKIADKSRDYVLIGRERNDVGRPGDAGFPVRGVISEGFLYLRNYKSERWPAGNPETGYLDVDGSPTKTLILNMRRSGESGEYWKYNFGKRSSEELYYLGNDRDCMNNLANDAGYNNLKRRLNERLYNELLVEGDPRAFGKGDVFDAYPYAEDKHRDFYTKFRKGEIKRADAGWVDSTDFETDIF